MLVNPKFKSGLISSPEPGVFFVESYWDIKEKFKACEFLDSIELRRSYAWSWITKDFELADLEEYAMLSFLGGRSFPGQSFVTIYQFDKNCTEICVWELE